MALDHVGARKLMAEAVEGQLSPDDERDLALHLVGCAECKVVYEGLQQAHPALSSIELGEASRESVEAAVHRAITVLRGDADPGPMGLSDEAPRLPEIPDVNTVRIDSHYEIDESLFRPVGPHMPTGPMQPPVPEAHVRPIEPETNDALDVPLDLDEPRSEEPFPLPEESLDVPPPPPLPVDPTPRASIEPEQRLPPEPEAAPEGPPVAEIETLLDEDRTRFDPLPVPDEDEREGIGGPGPWLLAIAVAVLLAVIAGVLVFRGQGLFGGGGGDLPDAAEVKRRMKQTFIDMKSLKATFDIQRVGLYRVGRDENSLEYTFANGRYVGHIDYDRSLGYKQDFTLDVGGDELDRVDMVQTSEETQSLIGSGSDRRLLIEKNPPLGPPDGNLRPALGLLEDALGSSAALIHGADDLKVVGRTERDDRELYTVVANVRATEHSRADRIEAALDAKTLLPVIVKRSISRENARVLGPEDALSDAAIDRAFANNSRVTSELVQLDAVAYDEIVLPNDLVLDVPDGSEEQTRDSKFERLARPELSNLDFRPLLPRNLPAGYEEQLFARYTGEPQGWGPGNALPKPEHVFHAEYFDGKTTIVLTERQLDKKFEIKDSPLARGGLPITVRRVSSEGKEFFFGASPEVAPHAFGFVGNTFVMAVGYAPQSQLVRVLSSLTEAPSAIPGAIDLSPAPTGSPGASPSASPLASPTATPAATVTP